MVEEHDSNRERIELGDIDIDIASSKRPTIIKKIKQERSQFLNHDLSDLCKDNLGLTLIATFGTETAKSAIATACRGYRAEGFEEGIDVDIAQFLSSLVPVERGFVWPIKDVLKGNKEKDRKPVAMFINEVKKYPGLVEIILGIEGLIKQRGSHASGVIMFDKDPFSKGCFMKTPSGEIITQYDLHSAEAAGLTKYDFLVTEIQDKLVTAINLLKENNEIDKNKTLKEIYDEYFHPEVLNIKDEKVWDNIDSGTILDLFQFDSPVGAQAIRMVQPRSMLELSDANGLMRLMTSEKGQDTPIQKYTKFKNDIQLWYDEMDRYGLTKEEQKIVEPYFKPSYGVPPSQEQLMMMVMDKNICNFTLAEANSTRKIVGKKQMSKIPELHEKVLSQASSERLGHYVWECGIGPQMG